MTSSWYWYSILEKLNILSFHKERPDALTIRQSRQVNKQFEINDRVKVATLNVMGLEKNEELIQVLKYEKVHLWVTIQNRKI